jgi:NADH-quinone oxidoreductase subunit G
MPAQGDVGAGWRWLRDIGNAAGSEAMADWQALDDVIAAVAAGDPALAGVRDAAPPADFRLMGQMVARQPLRYSGRTAMNADRTIHEPHTGPDIDSPLAFSMEGYPGRPPAALQPRFWAPAWNSEQAMIKFQKEPGGRLARGSSGVRLFEKRSSGHGYEGRAPAPFRPAAGRLLALASRHVFGSEELSALAPAVARMAPAPRALMNRADAEGRHIVDGSDVRVSWRGAEWAGPVHVSDALPEGVIMVPSLIAEGPALGLPAWAEVQAGEPGEEAGE